MVSLDFTNIFQGSSAITSIYQGSTLVWPLSSPETPLTWIGNGDDYTASQDVWFDSGLIPQITYAIRVVYSTSQFTNTQGIVAVFDNKKSPYYHFSIHHPRNSSVSIFAEIADTQGISYNQNELKVAGQVYDAKLYTTVGATYLTSYTTLVIGPSGGTPYSVSVNMASSAKFNNFKNTVPRFPFYFFARNNVGNPDIKCYGGTKIYGVQIYSSNSYSDSDLVADFRPYLVEGVPCFKDIIGGTYHYNQGTGTVTYG